MARTLRILNTEEEKRRTTALYRRCFPEDSEAFVDFYYRERCRGNRILSIEEEGEVLSMLHLNPYRISLFSRETEISYVYAVATEERFRRQGMMRMLLREAFRILKRERVPLSYLIPVEEAIYTPFGYETVGRLQRERHISEERLREYSLYCIRDSAYQRLIAGEERLENGAGEGLPEDPKIMMKITDPDRFCELSGLSEKRNEADCLDRLKKQKTYISEDI